MTKRSATRVAFIRGINVGGRAVVPMAELREALTARGFADVRMYIHSGNVVQEAPTVASNSGAAPAKEAAEIRAAIEEQRGFAPVVMVFTAADVAGASSGQPLRISRPVSGVLVFVDGHPAELGDLVRFASNGEEWHAFRGVVHLHCPSGIGRSNSAHSSLEPRAPRRQRTTSERSPRCSNSPASDGPHLASRA